ncbi:isoamylase early set domain-containing protein [Georgenia sp. M64]|uniref:isoamylase early set domain-containing protein n=1 Tax=Georgenia sp. M64 TaxID=3120520 RepID=UPI0030DF5405
MIKQSTAPAAGRKLTFALPADHPAGVVSVVGTFNDWTPGAHVLKRRSNGTMSVAVTVPAGTDVHFRYLGENGTWFDDPDADRIAADGGYVTL